MMYQEKFVTAIRVAGKILRETGDKVLLPFGAEYSLVLKNKNSVRALVSVEIDGVDATGGTQLIIPANGTVDFERFIKDGNFDEGLRFKFIERTKKIEDGPRGIGAEDGLIRIQFEFEQQKPAYIPGPVYGGPVYSTVWRYPTYWNGSLYDGGATLTSTAGLSGATRSIADVKLGASGVAEMATAYNCAAPTGGTITAKSAAAAYDPKSMQEDFFFSSNAGEPKVEAAVGITVGGSVSDQKFVTGAWFPTDGVKHVMIMKLLGQIGEQRIQEAVTVKTKQECPTCGTKNKFGTKFCKECGTGLTIV